METPVAVAWHAMPEAEALDLLRARLAGLSPAEASARLLGTGPNVLQTAPGPNLLLLFLTQFRSPLVYMLLIATLISFATGHVVDAVVILIVLILNAIVGVAQEWRAEQALEALRRLSAPRARVLRDGVAQIIPAEDVVPGDMLLLESGDRVAADARLLESSELQVDESALTGESRPVEKQLGVLPERLPLADQINMVWMSTPVTHGRGRAVVTATGMNTVMGEIAREVRGVQRACTPLQRRLARLGSLMGYAAVGLSLLIFLLGVLLAGYTPAEMLLVAVAAAVAAIPEGLPAVISVVLALGVQRMAARHAIIRRLPAVETLGSTTVICSDKTGTITRNEMTVTRLWAGGRVYQVTGEGYAPEGDISLSDAESAAALPPGVDALLILGVLANDAVLEKGEEGWHIHGDPTEGALLTAAGKGGIAPEIEREQAPRLDELPFSSKTKYMATLHRRPHESDTVLLVKGAPEAVLKFCTHALIQGRRVPLTDALCAEILKANAAFAGNALRVLAGAYREFPVGTEDFERHHAEERLTFAGLWGMIDPPRPDAVRAIADARQAGIRVVMITGDHAITASAIARRIGLTDGKEETISGEELTEMSDETLRRRVEHIAVYARVSPSDKLRIVAALRDRGAIVAMTGDGVNDAPALKSADIGVAMGITGTEVAKEAADMVLTDDNFATIVHAVEEGRIIFGNLQKVVFFLLTSNLAEIITLLIALLVGLPLPLTAVMILWVNLVTDGACTIPVGLEPRHGDVLSNPPRPREAGIIDANFLHRMLLHAPVMAAGTLLLFWWEGRVYGEDVARTMAFTTLAAYQWVHAFVARSRVSSLFTIGVTTNRWLLYGVGVAVLLQVMVVHWDILHPIFSTTDLTLPQWGLVILVASTVLWVDELTKLIMHRRHGHQVVKE
ncbi:MAG: Calcium-transporting ATPase 1 [bacterium ADurb.Bin429]|nr:MAG: Calcium-transporting ATPase 1 [bacterium ADurb.Bin429]